MATGSRVSNKKKTTAKEDSHAIDPLTQDVNAPKTAAQLRREKRLAQEKLDQEEAERVSGDFRFLPDTLSRC